MDHEREVPHYEGEIDELGRIVGRLTYDQTATFIVALAADLQEQATADKGRGRAVLADQLQEAARTLDEAAAQVNQAWEICKPHMTTEERGENCD